MIVLSSRLEVLRGEARACATEFRLHALALDSDPGDLTPYLSLEGVRWLSRLLVPREHNPNPLRLGNRVFDGMDCLERVVALEELAYGDAGLLFASPGASMSQGGDDYAWAAPNSARRITHRSWRNRRGRFSRLRGSPTLTGQPATARLR